jgi:hypothetical protein
MLIWDTNPRSSPSFSSIGPGMAKKFYFSVRTTTDRQQAGKTKVFNFSCRGQKHIFGHSFQMFNESVSYSHRNTLKIIYTVNIREALKMHVELLIGFISCMILLLGHTFRYGIIFPLTELGFINFFWGGFH